jgi:restriction system protein
LTTGLFTSDAQREAVRDGVPTIELVDKDRLIALMESKQIGVKPRVVYDVDNEFFDLFREA